MIINLKEFIEGYKTSEVVCGELRRKFREPKLKDLDKPIMEILELGCIEGDRSAFKTFLEDISCIKNPELLERHKSVKFSSEFEFEQRVLGRFR